MNMFTIPLLLVSLLSSMNVMSADGGIPANYSLHNKSMVFFVKPVDAVTSADFISMYDAKWYYEESLRHDEHGDKQVSTCADLVVSLNDGYRSPTNDEYDYISAVNHLCVTWREISKLGISDKTYLDGLQLNKSLASVLPPQLAMTISKHDKSRLMTMPSWDAMSAMMNVIPLNHDQALFETKTGTQKLTVMAKGDYNKDGVEDVLVYLEDNVKGGSYSAVRAFVLTRLEGSDAFSILHQW
ncbi:hypothetical protein L4C36_18375 [Photobacterium japonica]|uniref:hypothetical protein n=1 Tax=Photobacterium japonica TaxID=2910235 RepID=UPI003D0B7146